MHAQAASGPRNLANDTLLHAQTTSRAWRQTFPSARQPARLFLQKLFFTKTWQPAHCLHVQTASRALLTHSSFFLLPKTWQPARCLHAQAASGPQNLANLHVQTTSRAWWQTFPSARQPARFFFQKKILLRPGNRHTVCMRRRQAGPSYRYQLVLVFVCVCVFVFVFVFVFVC